MMRQRHNRRYIPFRYMREVCSMKAGTTLEKYITAYEAIVGRRMGDDDLLYLNLLIRAYRLGWSLTKAVAVIGCRWSGYDRADLLETRHARGS